jgi:hypothetical protein
LTNVTFALIYLLELSHVAKIDVVINYGQNTFNLQLVQYILQYKILKLYVASKLIYLCLYSYVASFEIKCSVCRVYSMID